MRFFSILLVTLLLSSCNAVPYNPTVFNYQITPHLAKDATRLKKVIIAPVNFGKPSRLYLKKRQKYIDERITSYLEANGFTVLPSHLFETHWQQATRKHGQSYNPSTGKLTKAHQTVLTSTMQALAKSTEFDGIVFTDLIERQIQFTTGTNHMARWDGVLRKPSLQGTGAGVPTDFNWAAEVDAVSLWINIIDPQLKPIFSSIGGIEVTQSINLKGSKPRFVRRRNVLSHETQIDEGIKLAFHPLIAMKRYPRKTR